MKNWRTNHFPPQLVATLPETNIAPKNGWLEYFPIGEAYFQVRAVRFREGSFLGNENHPSNSNPRWVNGQLLGG